MYITNDLHSSKVKCHTADLVTFSISSLMRLLSYKRELYFLYSFSRLNASSVSCLKARYLPKFSIYANSSSHIEIFIRLTSIVVTVITNNQFDTVLCSPINIGST